MSYFDDASLVMIPSGYKTSKVYSVKPIDGTGDLTFTRASTATRVNASGLVEAVSSNVPRLDYLNSTCPRLILEPSRANLVLRSEEFDNAAWIKTNVTVTANSIISPDGSLDADTLTGNGSSGTHIIQQIILAYGANATISIFAKKGTNNFIQIYSDFVNTDYANFNLNTGVVGDKGTTTGATTITDYGNGWYRCTMVTGSALSGNVNIALISSATSARAETNSLSTNLYIYGAQLESSASYATSYIPTTTAAVTRLAESSSSASVPSLFGTTEGSFFIECTFDGRNASGAIPLFLRSSVSTSFNQATYLQFGASSVDLNVYSGTTLQAAISGGSFTTGQTLKIAFGYKANDFVLYVNGVQIGTDTSGAISTSLSFIDLGSYLLLQSTFQYDGKISQALLFKTRLSNSSLAELTTI